jgi:5-methyltetrahydropteroyltriglutamate--homocysteine methyltransferase
VRIMYAKEEGQTVDRAELATHIRDAVAGVVAQQKEAGIDIINDGEMSKPSYATYVKDRLSGFGGTGNTFVYQDLVDFPNLAKRVFGDPGRSRRKTPACNGPIAFRDAEAVQTDIENLASAIGTREGRHAFISAASPGVISLFFRNDYYSSEDAYLEAIGAAMRFEYEAIVAAGFDLQRARVLQSRKVGASMQMASGSMGCKKPPAWHGACCSLFLLQRLLDDQSRLGKALDHVAGLVNLTALDRRMPAEC